MSRKYFGTDGIRGTVGLAPITPDFVLRLAGQDFVAQLPPRAIASYLSAPTPA